MRLFLKIAFLILSTSILATPGFGEAQDLTRIVKRFAKRNHIPGVELTVLRGGRVEQTIYAGYANLEQHRRVTNRSIFRIASVTKQFTTQAIMVLRERGLLSLDDKLSKYFPTFPKADQVTLTQLLQHTSGTPDIPWLEGKDWSPEELLAAVMEKPYQFEPGTSAVYCNTNFILLGVIIEQVSGMPYGDFVRENVVKALGMNPGITRVGSDSLIIPNRAAGYVYDSGQMWNASFASVHAPFATGDFMSRTVDFIKLAKSLRRGHSPLFSDASIEEMIAPAVLNDGSVFMDDFSYYPFYEYSYGYGLELLRPHGGDRWIITKGGAVSGFRALVAYFRRSDVAIAYVGNSETYPYQLLRTISEHLKLKA